MEDEVICDEEEEEGGSRVALTPVRYVVRQDPTRKAILCKIRELEEGQEAGAEESPEEVEATLQKICALYDLLESDGMATGRATNILKELGLA